ncbi:MAG: hypothetical protein KME31_32850 [Tolypothrix carrinoi HA7290-LM1]|nr:hypothetical protein [Tolypothrix carrinoi HA7290-LM1]
MGNGNWVWERFFPCPMTAGATTFVTSLRVRQSRHEGNPPAALVSPQRTASPMPYAHCPIPHLPDCNHHYAICLLAFGNIKW